MAEKYIIAIIKLDDTLLSADKLHLPTMADTLNTLTENVAPCGSLDLLGVYLVDEAQSAVVLDTLDHHSLPFPTDSLPQRVAEVVHLHDRRPRPQSSD